MERRGFVAIGLHRPKTPANVGGVLRAAGCYGADLVVVGGRRLCNYANLNTDTQKAWRHIPTLTPEELFDGAPLGAVPIAVDLIPGAISLPSFVHPERAFYVFGPEDGTLGREITSKCKFTVSVPTAFCMNLAATVNVVLYDRAAKQMLAERRIAA